MKNHLAGGLVAGWLAATTAVSYGTVIYGVPEASGNAVGGWDVNIMADDIHFATAAIISKISMRFAIRGTQTCKLWIFDGFDKAPLHTVAFTNIPVVSADDVSTYDFDMELLVPKDIYVGFSAQGDGWGGATNIDYWALGSGVPVGVEGTPGQYYYGSVAGGKLTAVFAPAGNMYFGCLEVLSEPLAHIDAVAVVTGHVQLAIAALPVSITSIVERSDSVDGTNWQSVATLPLGASNQTWSTSNPVATSFYYRVTSH